MYTYVYKFIRLHDLVLVTYASLASTAAEYHLHKPGMLDHYKAVLKENYLLYIELTVWPAT